MKITWRSMFFLVVGVILFIAVVLTIPWPLTLESILTVTTIVVTFGGAWIALEGLTAWKKQLHGKTDYDMAWQFLEATFNLRDAINHHVRNPAVSWEEAQSAVEEFYGKEFDIAAEMKNNPQAEDRAVYNIRWKEVIKARNAFHQARVKAEIWWGKHVSELERDLNHCIGVLYSEIMKMVHPERGLIHDHDTIYYLPEYESAFDKQLNTALNKIERFTQKYLRA